MANTDRSFILASELMVTILQDGENLRERYEKIDFNEKLWLSAEIHCGEDLISPEASNDLFAKIDIEVFGRNEFDKAIEFYSDFSEKSNYFLEIEEGKEELEKIARDIKESIPYKNKLRLESIWHGSNGASYSVSL